MRYPVFAYGGALCPTSACKYNSGRFRLFSAFGVVRFEHDLAKGFWLELSLADVLRASDFNRPAQSLESALDWALRISTTASHSALSGRDPRCGQEVSKNGGFYAYVDAAERLNVFNSRRWPSSILSVPVGTVVAHAIATGDDRTRPLSTENPSLWIARLECAGYETE